MERQGASRLRPLRERDGQLVNNWYIACLLKELPANKPIGRVIYDTPLVIFRDASGKPVCLHDRCLHRHARLSEGDVFDGQIGCPYHGWVYDSDGQAVGVPSAGKSFKPCKSRQLKSFPTVVQDDCIWVWMGDSEPTTPAPPYRFPFWRTSGWQGYFMVTDFDNEVTNLAENFMDVPHTVFVHAGWFRNERRRLVPITIDSTDQEVLVTYLDQKDDIGFSKMILNPKSEAVTHTDRFIMPNITRVDYMFGKERGFVISSQCTPVSSLKTRVYTEIAFRLGAVSPLMKPFLRFYTRRVIEQDVDIMANQAKNLALDPTTNFHNTEADDVHVAIEALRDAGAAGLARPTNPPPARVECEIWV